MVTRVAGCLHALALAACFSEKRELKVGDNGDTRNGDMRWH